MKYTYLLIDICSLEALLGQKMSRNCQLPVHSSRIHLPKDSILKGEWMARRIKPDHRFSNIFDIKVGE